MKVMGTHQRNYRHAGSGTGTYPWPLLLIAAPAAVAIWSGWVGLGSMCGFGPVNLLPGIGGGLHLDTAITLPVGIESYGAYALFAWLGLKGASGRTRDWARKSAVGALVLGCLGQVAYHLLAAAHWTEAPPPVTVGVACLPVVTLYFAATLTHLILADRRAETEAAEAAELAKAEREAARAARAELAVAAPAVPGPAKRSGAGAPKPGGTARVTAPADDLALEAKALELLAGDLAMSGAELARRLGVSASYGRKLRRRLTQPDRPAVAPQDRPAKRSRTAPKTAAAPADPQARSEQ